MVNFGEETVELDVFSGMTGSLYYHHPEIPATIKNLIKTGPKELTVREDFANLQSLGYTVGTEVQWDRTSFLPSLSYQFESNGINFFTANYDAAFGAANVFFPSIWVCSNTNIQWLDYISGSTYPTAIASYTQTTSKPIKHMCQYKDRFYGTNSLDAVFSLSGFSTGGGALTIGATLLAKYVSYLVTFRNRIFGLSNNRIYYTDIPAIGLYPETWNATTNFIDVSVDGSVNLYSALVFKDKLYIFSDRGIYLLTVNGDPINWSLQLVSADFPIYSRNQVCISRNTIYITDQNGVYSFNGVTFQLVSDVIHELFTNNSIAAYVTSYSVYPFENGIIMARNGFVVIDIGGPPGNYRLQYQTGDMFYYDGEVWVKLDIGNTDFKQLCFADNNFAPLQQLSKSESIIYYLTTVSGVASTPTFRCMQLVKGSWKGDVLSTNWAGGTRYRKPVQIDGPAPFVNQRKKVRLKSLYTYGIINDFGNAGTTDLVIGSRLLIPANMNASYSAINTEPQTNQSSFEVNRSKYSLVGTIGSSVQGIDNAPALIITGAEMIVNTDNMPSSSVRES